MKQGLKPDAYQKYRVVLAIERQKKGGLIRPP